MGNTQNIQGLWDNYKRCDTPVMGKPEEEREKGAEEIFAAILTENFSKLMSATKP